MSDHLESCSGAPWDVTNAAKNPNGVAAERETALDVPRLTAVLRAVANSPEFWQHGLQLRALADRLAALSTAEREREALHQQLGSSIDVARETMTEITTGRLASIGGIENTYCPQISVSRVKKLHERLVALADSYRGRFPSGGEEGR